MTNNNEMKRITQITFAALLTLMIASCGNSKKEGNAAITEKKTQLEKLKSEKDKNDQQILKLQEELSKLDTSSSNPSKIKLVAFTPIVRGDFNHFIELQGRVDAENIFFVSPNGQGGLVKQVFVKQGDNVRKGQLLLKLDDAILRQNVQATKQQAGAVNSQLTLARSVYNRQKNLWDQGIGTEVQLLTNKTNVTTLENQLQQINEAVRLAQEQLNTSNVYSNVSGVADQVLIRPGETFTPGSNAIRIVNTSVLKVTGNIPENYISNVRKGTPVIVQLPDANKTFNTTVNFIGAGIDPNNRGFVAEAKLPSDPALKPNQVALMKIRDYSSANTIAIPLNTLQNDEKGKFVLVASEENGKLFARKRPVTIGKLNGNLLEITGGLKDGDKLITEGYTGLYEGQQLTTAAK
jgi:membrane fusion protein (multidrug efflux system)